MRHRLEPLAYCLLLLAALLACGKGSRSSGSSRSTPGVTTTGESAVSVAASELMADYQANEVRGDNRWKDKLVNVTGVVGDIKKDILDHPYVTLGTGAAFEFPEIQCSLASGQEGAAANLSKGTKATFKGHVKGLMMNVLLDDCELVPGAGAAPAAAAAQPSPHADARSQPARAPARPPHKR